MVSRRDRLEKLIVTAELQVGQAVYSKTGNLVGHISRLSSSGNVQVLNLRGKFFYTNPCNVILVRSQRSHF